jgi:hypothetical protein
VFGRVCGASSFRPLESPELEDAGVFTVRNLHRLSKEGIKELGLPPVVFEYLLRVKG